MINRPPVGQKPEHLITDKAYALMSCVKNLSGEVSSGSIHLGKIKDASFKMAERISVTNVIGELSVR